MSSKQTMIYLRPSDEAMVDVEIRRYGFTIHSRPEKGPTMWERNGTTFPQREVLEIMEKEDPLPIPVEAAEKRPAYKTKGD